MRTTSGLLPEVVRDDRQYQVNTGERSVAAFRVSICLWFCRAHVAEREKMQDSELISRYCSATFFLQNGYLYHSTPHAPHAPAVLECVDTYRRFQQFIHPAGGGCDERKQFFQCASVLRCTMSNKITTPQEAPRFGRLATLGRT